MKSGRSHRLGHFKATHTFIQYNLTAFKVSPVVQNDLAGQIWTLSFTHLVHAAHQQLATFLSFYPVSIKKSPVPQVAFSDRS